MTADQTTAPQRPGVRLRVLTYNIHGQRDDRAALAEVVRQIAPDVAILQEAPRRWRWRTRSAALANAFDMVVGSGGPPPLGNLVLTTLRVRVGSTWSVRFPLTPGRHLRGAVFARCAVGPARFVVVGSHLSTDPTERPAQARLLRQACADVDGPVILGLDVNDQPADPDDPPTSGTDARFASGTDAPPPGDTGAAWRLAAAGFTDAAAAAGAGRAGTFPGRDPRRRIDAIFVDPRIEVVGCQVVDTPAARRASDHLPVVADLVLTEPAPGLDKRGG
ncbi:endonuclease/exonuclease/phosphatase family protein [Solwaraspora sp. WMMD792]|uniref:endonuclease/exonuclease/phosphatase family protein n=1 Tax=Solwaraspora sp. WMMD792 TaxID=3016099 RepID=UPI0024173A85|nr:endonuclease/exonuclease/phosphatase family protein [Solwaraspora sp. WMMD792]MDG4772064.1 endonuclease/exonuclease/phosphatase family protein [Solwaraspora sp. WMMD792]